MIKLRMNKIITQECNLIMEGHIDGLKIVHLAHVLTWDKLKPDQNILPGQC